MNGWEPERLEIPNPIHLYVRYIHLRWFLDAIAPTPVSEWVSSGSVIKSFRFGDSYRISKLCELVLQRQQPVDEEMFKI